MGDAERVHVFKSFGEFLEYFFTVFLWDFGVRLSLQIASQRRTRQKFHYNVQMVVSLHNIVNFYNVRMTQQL